MAPGSGKLLGKLLGVASAGTGLYLSKDAIIDSFKEDFWKPLREHQRRNDIKTGDVMLRYADTVYNTFVPNTVEKFNNKMIEKVPDALDSTHDYILKKLVSGTSGGLTAFLGAKALGFTNGQAFTASGAGIAAGLLLSHYMGKKASEQPPRAMKRGIRNLFMHRRFSVRQDSMQNIREGADKMPVHRTIMPDGTIGWQWGNQKKYKDKEKAEAQGRAILATGWREGKQKTDGKKADSEGTKKASCRLTYKDALRIMHGRT